MLCEMVVEMNIFGGTLESGQLKCLSSSIDFGYFISSFCSEDLGDLLSVFVKTFIY